MAFVMIVVVVASSGDISHPISIGKYPNYNSCLQAKKLIQPDGYPALSKPAQVTAWCLPAGP